MGYRIIGNSLFYDEYTVPLGFLLVLYLSLLFLGLQVNVDVVARQSPATCKIIRQYGSGCCREANV